MQQQRASSRLLLLASLAASACTEQTAPTAIPVRANAAVTATAGTNNQKVKVKTMQLSANTLRIDGPSVSGSVSIGNSGLAIQSGVVVRGEITQGTVSKPAVSTPAQCSPSPDDAGKLPTGTCDMTFAAVASNSAPGSVGSLAPGSATFILHVIQTSDAGDTELASKSLLVNLVATPSMTVTLSPTTITIGGAAATATAVIQNPANSLPGVLLQGWLIQGVAPNQVRKATGGSLVTCGSNAGVLPPGTCTMTIPVSASNAASGIGTLVAGPATFQLELNQSTSSGTTTFDVETVPVTLVVPQPVRITGVTIPASITLGAATPFTAFIDNTAGALSPVVLQGTITQGTASRAAGGRQVQCNSGPIGELPTGSCTVFSNVVAFNAPNAGTGTLIPGAATLQLDLQQGSTVLDTKTIPITLVMSGPGIIGIELSARDVLIGESLNYTATFYNPTNTAISSAGIQGYLTQDPIFDFGTGGTTLTCAGANQGELPPGLCAVSFTLGTRNVFGTPAWNPGAATWRLELTTGNTLLDSKELVIFLYRLQ